MMTPAESFFRYPDGMSEDAAEQWRHIVDAHPRGSFQAGDVPLLGPTAQSMRAATARSGRLSSRERSLIRLPAR